MVNQFLIKAKYIMKLSDNQIEILKNIKSKLPRGSVGLIAKNIEKSPGWVSQALNPDDDTYDEKVVDEAIKIINDKEQKEKELLANLTGG